VGAICGLRLKLRSNNRELTVFDKFCTKRAKIGRTIQIEPDEVLFSLKYNCTNLFGGCNVKVVTIIQDISAPEETQEKTEEITAVGNRWSIWLPLSKFKEGEFLIVINTFEWSLLNLLDEEGNLESTISFVLRVKRKIEDYEKGWML